MTGEKNYYISIDGKKFEMCRELYEAYTKGRRKDTYFTHDLKQEHKRVNKKTGEAKYSPDSGWEEFTGFIHQDMRCIQTGGSRN